MYILLIQWLHVYSSREHDCDCCWYRGRASGKPIMGPRVNFLRISKARL